MNAQLARLIAAQVCLHAAMAGVRLTAPLFALSLGHSAWSVGLLLSMFALAQVILSIPAGRYADRQGLYRPLRISVVGAIFGASLAIVWPTFPVLCVAAFCTGGATGSLVIALQRHAGRLANDSRQLKQIFSWLSLGPALSNFIGPLSAGLMIDYFSFRAAFALMAILPLFSWYFARNIRDQKPPQPIAHDQPRPSTWSLLNNSRFRLLMLINWLLASCWDIHAFVVPILGHQRHFSASSIGAILGTFSLAAFAVRLLLPIFAAHLREWQVMMSAMLATAFTFAIYPFMPDPLSMGLCAALLGFSLGSVQPMAMSMLHQLTPAEQHGQAIGLRLLIINTSSVGMPLFFGSVGITAGVSAVFWVTGLAVGLGARLAWRMGQNQD